MIPVSPSRETLILYIVTVMYIYKTLERVFLNHIFQIDFSETTKYSKSVLRIY